MIALVIMMGVTKLGIIGSAADLNISWTIVLFLFPCFIPWYSAWD